MFCSSQQTATVSKIQIFPPPVQEAVFSFRKFQSIGYEMHSCTYVPEVPAIVRTSSTCNMTGFEASLDNSDNKG